MNILKILIKHQNNKKSVVTLETSIVLLNTDWYKSFIKKLLKYNFLIINNILLFCSEMHISIGCFFPICKICICIDVKSLDLVSTNLKEKKECKLLSVMIIT